MTTENKRKRLLQARSRIEAGGGNAAMDKIRDTGRRTVRERLGLLFDEGSFVETDAFVAHRATELGMDKMETPGEGVVTGYGTVEGRQVFAFAQDFSVMGGSLGEMHAKKIQSSALTRP